MRTVDYNFGGKTLHLSFTADALFQCYDKFGFADDFIAAADICEPTAVGWKNLCWLTALMAAQGELQRRHMGYEAEPMTTMEELRTGVLAGDGAELRQAVLQAVALGLRRSNLDDSSEGEVNLILKAREDEAKKGGGLANSVQSILRHVLRG